MKRLLIAFDGTDPSWRALDTAIELARALPVEIGVVTVRSPYTRPRPVAGPTAGSAEPEELQQAAAVLESHGFRPALFQPVGEPAKAIEQVAQDHDYDLIVIGRRDLTPYDRFVEGSVSAHVVSHAPSTVVVAR